MEIVDSAKAYKHEYTTPPPRGDSFGSPLPTPMSSNIAEDGSRAGSVLPRCSPNNMLSILDFGPRTRPTTPDVNKQNEQDRHRDSSMVRREEEYPADHDAYTRGEGFIYFQYRELG